MLNYINMNTCKENLNLSPSGGMARDGSSDYQSTIKLPGLLGIGSGCGVENIN